MGKPRLFGLIFIVLCSLLSANPFTGSQQSTRFTVNQGGAMPQNIISLQNDLRLKIVSSFHHIQDPADHSAFLQLLLLAFIYGIFHAAGPGHRKAVVFSAFIAKKAHRLEPALAGLMLAGLHVLASIVLVFSIQLISGRIIGSTVDRSSTYLDTATIFILFVFVLILFFIKLTKILQKSGKPAEAEDGLNNRNIYTTMFISGLIPCPGATLILIFSVSLNMPWQGIAAVIAMSLGMGITISLVAYLAYFGKEALFRALQNNKKIIARVSAGLELGGLFLILIFCVYLLVPLFL